MALEESLDKIPVRIIYSKKSIRKISMGNYDGL